MQTAINRGISRGYLRGVFITAVSRIKVLRHLRLTTRTDKRKVTASQRSEQRSLLISEFAAEPYRRRSLPNVSQYQVPRISACCLRKPDRDYVKRCDKSRLNGTLPVYLDRVWFFNFNKSERSLSHVHHSNAICREGSRIRARFAASTFESANGTMCSDETARK